MAKGTDGTRLNAATGEHYLPRHEPRYREIASFLRAPLADTLEALDIALVGIPFDGGVSNRPGTRHGPREIRNQSSMMRSAHHITGLDPFAQARIADIGDVRFSSIYDLEKVSDDIAAYYAAIRNAGVIPLSAGGDHSVTFPILRGLAADDPVGLIQIDAHTDTWDEFQGSKFHHGGPFRLACEQGLVDPKRTVQIGIRGAQNTTQGWDYSHDTSMRVMFMEEVDALGIDAVIAEARRVVGNGPVYLSFDIDSIDPAFAPGTGTPEVGGLTSLQALQLVRGFRGLPLIGADVVEVSPPFDPSGITALMGATLMYELLCLMAEGVDNTKT
ncbi:MULTISPECIES: agmatinase [unclassified Halomonas]|uniref:agmatinase n=1 Tax=unclassified Halomonas TaxID=2609666 RepID=UPI0006D948F4|nr:MULTISPECIES: agmatinase [unclassified Halomonas]KPQ21467.1 MAG: agmatinase [Halomonas sp. HL-93]SBR50183.1 agmatinase [Halomonas sp. HL-93]SNY96709.1 agmatinase [Halomonas sp. hl-4]